MFRPMKTLPVLAALGAVAPAFAEGSFDYSYVEAGWAQTNLTAANVDGNGFGLGGSFALGPNFHGFANYLNQDFGQGVKVSGYEVGLGFNRSLTSGLDLLGRASYVRGDTDVGPGPNLSDDGFGLSVLLRGQLVEHLELGGGIQYVDLHEAGSTTSFDVNGVYSFTDHLHAVAGLNFADGAHTLRLGVRYSFGQ